MYCKFKPILFEFHFILITIKHVLSPYFTFSLLQHKKYFIVINVIQ